MKKTIENTDTGRIIHTTNGVDTRTGAVYVREIKPYDKPLANGFNKELADDVLDQIRATPLLWNQDVWRHVFDVDQYETLLPDNTDERKTVDLFTEIHGRKPVLDDLQDELQKLSQPDATCGTAMCFAGWVGELTAANYVVDATLIKAMREAGSSTATPAQRELGYAARNVASSDVLITREEAEDYDPYDVIGILGRYHPVIAEHLKQRGFTEETHRVVGVDVYARQRLGLGRRDNAGLFLGYNTFGDVEKIVDVLAKRGPDAERPRGLGGEDGDGDD